MHFGEDDGAGFAPPTVDSVGAAFPVLLATLAPQPSIREIGVNTIATGSGLEAAAIMYAILWNPDDLDDPFNTAELPPEVDTALANPPSRLTPAETEWMRWMRFPIAHEAVQTVVPRDGRSIAEELALHMRNVIGNTFREQRYPTMQDPDSFVDPPSAADAVDASVMVDGEVVGCVEIPDEHVLGLGVGLGDATALVVWPKHLLPLLRLELVRRPRPGAAEAA
ncbi:MAG: hypothetical protein ACQEWM_12560 [Actinomycetota bacterium]